MLKFFSRDGGQKKRAPRDRIKCSATLRINDRFHRAELHDVSASGCKIALEEPQNPGQFVQIALENFHSLGGSVRWCRDGLAGIQFIRPLSDAALSKWKRAVVNSTGKEEALPRHDGLRRDFWGDIRHVPEETDESNSGPDMTGSRNDGLRRDFWGEIRHVDEPGAP
jgi:hypothetical protein